jgi:two-component system osmolarity sensor histidine kinase EnvZ
VNAGPRTVFGQLALVIALALLGAGALALLLGREFASRPATEQLLRAIDAFADTVEALDRGQPPQRTVRLLRADGLEVRDSEPEASAGRLPLLRLIQRRANRALGDAREIRLGRGAHGDVLWLKLNTARPLWVAFAYGNNGLGARRFSVLLLGGCALLVWLAAAYFARRLVQPLRALAQAAPGIVRGEASPQLRIEGPREVAELAHALAQSGHDVRAAAEERALMLAGISHDLRTPLTRLQFALELLPDTDPELRAGMARDIDEVDAILSQFIAYARDGRDEAGETVDLAAICRNAVAASAAAWSVDAPAAAPLHGRPMALLRAVENLVVNAQKHGAAPFALRLSREGDAWKVEVADHGPGLSAETRERVRQPFARGGGNAGSGLGLAIVERVARQHGGELRLLPNAPRGLRAALLLRGD